MARHFFIASLICIVFPILIIGLVGEALIHPAKSIIGKAPNGFNVESIILKTKGNGSVAGWFAKGKPGRGAVLLLHGLRGNRLQMLERAKFLHQNGYSVCLIDLPAHGESSGDHITFGLDEAEGVNVALGYLTQQLPGEKLGVIGVSFGGASFVFANAQPAPSAVVLESMYPAITDAVADRLNLHIGQFGSYFAPLLLWQLPLRLGISPEQLQPIKAVTSLHMPLLIASGDKDQHTLLVETQRLYQAANAPKELWIVPGADHVDLYEFNRKAYEIRVLVFLDRLLRH